MKQTEEIHNVLWTGGWDSTYRVVELILKGAMIQPYYVIDKNRVSVRKEMDTIKLLRNKIVEAYPTAKDQLLEIIFVDLKSIKFNMRCRIAHKALKRRGHLGRQYYWLACLSRKINNMEVCLTKSDSFLRFLKGNVIEEEHPLIGSYYRLNPDVKDFFLQRIFKDMRFPTVTLTKLDMKEIAGQKGFLHIMNATWFCQGSTEKPCGKCNPCKQLIGSGIEYRLQH